MTVQRGNKRDAIIEAAAELIRSEGVHAASISEIIAQSGSSAGTIYHHFEGKNEIVLAVADRYLVQPLQRLLDASVDMVLSPADIFMAIGAAIATEELHSSLIVQLWAGSAIEPQLREVLFESFTSLRDELVVRITAWLTSQGALDAAERGFTLAMVTVGQAMGFLAQRTLMPSFDQEAYVEQACRLLNHVA